MKTETYEKILTLSAIDYVLRQLLVESDHFTEEETENVVAMLELTQATPTKIREAYVAIAQRLYKEVIEENEQTIQH